MSQTPAPKTTTSRPTRLPGAADQDAIRFERAVAEQGEWQARLKNVCAMAAALLGSVP